MKRTINRRFMWCIMMIMMLMMPGKIWAETYISEIRASNFGSDSEARSKLTNAGFTLVNQDLNYAGSGTHTGDYTYVGYKTSTNISDAITNIVAVYGDWGSSVKLDDGRTYYKAYAADSKSGNLNWGNGDTSIFLYYTKEKPE